MPCQILLQNHATCGLLVCLVLPPMDTTANNNDELTSFSYVVHASSASKRLAEKYGQFKTNTRRLERGTVPEFLNICTLRFSPPCKKTTTFSP